MTATACPAQPAAASSPRVWVLARNCRLTPRELALGCAVPVLFSLAGAVWIALQGFPTVILFALAEAGCVAVAFAAYARHACDRETVTLADGCLQVEQRCGGASRCARLAAGGLVVCRDAGKGGLVELRGAGGRVQVGRHLPPPARCRFEAELRAALRDTTAISPRESALPADRTARPTLQEATA